MRLVALATKCCAVTLSIFSTIIAVFFVHTEMCINSRARSRERQITERFRGSYKTVGPKCGRAYVTLLASEYGGGCKIFVEVLEPWLRKEFSLICIALLRVHL